MNPSDPQHPWSRLTAAARRAPDSRDITAPYGFSTRVAALAMDQKSAVNSLFERLSLRALGVACLLALLTGATNFSAVASTLDDADVATDDPVSEILEVVAS